jgi:phenylacetate-CoA ligase
MDRLVLRVGYGPGCTDRLERVRDDVMGAVAELIGLVPDVELVPEGELLRLGPPHKIPRVAKR